MNHHTSLISTSTATNNENLLTGTSVEAAHYPCINRETVGSPCIIRYIVGSREPSYLAGIAVPDANRSVDAAGVELVGTQRQRNPTDSLSDFMIYCKSPSQPLDRNWRSRRDRANFQSDGEARTSVCPARAQRKTKPPSPLLRRFSSRGGLSSPAASFGFDSGFGLVKSFPRRRRAGAGAADTASGASGSARRPDPDRTAFCAGPRSLVVAGLRRRVGREVLAPPHGTGTEGLA